MNRHQRRKWAQGIREASDEAAGVMDLLIVRPCELMDMLTAAMFDDHSARLSSLVTRTILSVYEAPAASPVQCLSCCQSVGHQDAFSVVLAIPHRDAPSKAVTSVMCPACGVEQDTIRDKAIAAFRDIWPNARAIDLPQHAGGHA